MSGQASAAGGSLNPRPTMNGTSGGNASMAQQRPSDNPMGVGNSGSSGGMSQQNLNGIVSASPFSTA